MDKKALPTHMLPTRDPPQNKRNTETENDRLETNFPSKQEKKRQGSNNNIKQNRLQKKDP